MTTEPSKKPQRSWTGRECAFLRDNYASLGLSGCAAHLNRPKPSVRKKAATLGLTPLHPHRAWTPEEIDFLRREYRRLGPNGCASRLSRTRDAVQRYAAGKLRITRAAPRPYSPAEIDAMRRNAHLPMSELAKLFPGRSPGALRHLRARACPDFKSSHPGPWAPEEDALLRRLAPSISDETAAAVIGRSKTAVQRRRWRLGIPCPLKWSDEDERTLRDLYGTLPYAAIAERLGRSINSVYLKCKQLRRQGLLPPIRDVRSYPHGRK